MNELFLIGYGGHGFVIADAALISNVYSIKGYYEIKESIFNPFNLKYMGLEKNIEFNSENQYFFPSIGSNNLRKEIVSLIEQKKVHQTKIIHPKSIISESSNIGKSTFISAGSVINPFVKICKGCIINTSSIIEHECIIGDFTHIGPGAVLAGNVTIGECSFIGANSVVIQGVNIGSNSVIGAGAVVINNIPDNQTWVGNPAKRIK
jgi:sugar O-acyltransferase (sialic acid O-acetyltransferase NeuD family)